MEKTKISNRINSFSKYKLLIHKMKLTDKVLLQDSEFKVRKILMMEPKLLEYLRINRKINFHYLIIYFRQVGRHSSG